MRWSVWILLCIPSRGAEFTADDLEILYDAARTVDVEVGWAAGSKLLRACVTETSPLTVTLEYEHRNEPSTPRIVEAFRPRRTGSWRIRDGGDVNARGCDGVAAHITTEVGQ